MTEQEKWEEEAKAKWEDYIKIGSISEKVDKWLRNPPDFIAGYLQACRKRQEEIERLRGYEMLFKDLKNRIIKDKEQGYIKRTARAWLLVQKYQEAK